MRNGGKNTYTKSVSTVSEEDHKLSCAGMFQDVPGEEMNRLLKIFFFKRRMTVPLDRCTSASVLGG